MQEAAQKQKKTIRLGGEKVMLEESKVDQNKQIEEEEENHQAEKIFEKQNKSTKSFCSHNKQI